MRVTTPPTVRRTFTTMWIKTSGRGTLYNTDTIESIDYDEYHDVTKGYIGDEWFTIAKGDVRPQIFASLRLGKSTMEVVNHE